MCTHATDNAVENLIKAACLQMNLELGCRNTREAVLKMYLKRKDAFVTLPNGYESSFTCVHSATATPGSVEVIDFLTVTRSRYTACSLWCSMWSRDRSSNIQSNQIRLAWRSEARLLIARWQEAAWPQTFVYLHIMINSLTQTRWCGFVHYTG